MKLPINYKILYYPGTIEIEDENGKMVGSCGRPYEYTPIETIIDYILTPIMKKEVYNWMTQNTESCIDKATNEINITSLVQLAAEKFNFDLDDENHWIWEMALEIEKDYEKWDLKN